MNRGDIIELSSPDIPLPCIQATVIEAENPDYIEVMSTLLIPFQHGGKFARTTTKVFGVIVPAEQAIPRETGFSKGQLVTCHLGTGKVIAGFDRIVVAERTDGELMTGGAMYFSLLDATPTEEDEGDG